jgi:hypothetical protein
MTNDLREMTNDQFPMTNGGGRTQRAVQQRHEDSVRLWSFVIGIWSLPWIIREGVRE